MKNIILILSLAFFISNCSYNKVVKKHGVRNLEKKQLKLEIDKSNTNDIKSILGPPSTSSKFDNNIWIYIEREMSREPLLKLGKEIIITNNALILEINNKGILVKKDFHDIESMKEIDFVKNTTENVYTKKSFVYDFLSSLRKKINDPLGKRKSTNN